MTDSLPCSRVATEGSLIDYILSWSLDDVLNQQLFKAKVESIPESFLAVDQYFGSFVYPLLEETRAALSSSLDNISRAPYAQTFQYYTRERTKLCHMKVDIWRNRLGFHGRGSYKTLPGDIFILTEDKPERISDMRFVAKGWAAKVEESSNGHEDDSICLRVEAFKDNHVNFSSGWKYFVVFLMNVRTYERVWKSLHMKRNLSFLKQIFSSDSQDEETRGLCSRQVNQARFDESDRSMLSKLNESQRKVVQGILSKAEYNQGSAVELVWGPPGTGKTKTLSILLYILFRMKYKTLICASTDVVIQQVALRVLNLIKNTSSYPLGSILYFRDNGAAKADADIAEIEVNHQVKGLDEYVKTASLVFCTASSSYLLHSLLTEPVKFLIIDEAAQLKECESCIPLQLPGVEHTLLFGDHFQLTATVTSNVSANAGFGRSLFERLHKIGFPKHILDVQYRMHPLIRSLSNSLFYANHILNAPSVTTGSYVTSFLPSTLFGSFSFINVSCGYEEMESLRCSFKNMVEVAIVIKIVQKLFKAWSQSEQKLGIGIISLDVAQVVAINEKIGQKYVNHDGFSVKVDTVEGFQGGEEDIIILSTVRTNSGGSLGFLSSIQITNVALTRARYCLWIVGNGKALLDSNSIWKNIVQDAKDRKCFHEAEEDDELAEVLLQVKSELDQFDDVLNADSVLFRNARWKILFSENFKKSFERLKPCETKKLVLNLLLRLSCGWRPKRRNTNLVCDNFSEMLKQFKVKEVHLICSNDISKEDSLYIQVLRVWDLLPLEDIPNLVQRLNPVFMSYSDEFINRCKKKRMEGDLEVPMSWNNCAIRHKSHQVQSGNNSSAWEVDGFNASDSLLMLKFYSLSSNVVNRLLTGCDGSEMEFPFELTDEEMEIVHFSRSSFILARSGTGKTTVLIMKLFQKEQLHHLSLEGFHEVEGDSSTSISSRKETDGHFLRQIFVTVNARLCYCVKQYVSSLQRSTCGWNSPAESSKTVEDSEEIMEFSDIPDSFAALPRGSYPLVITFNKFLLMLDGTVGTSFFKRFPESRKMNQEKMKALKSMALKTFIRTREVTYKKFSTSYWPFFTPTLTKKLDPSTVFSEIISHIKGGSRVAVNDDILSREDYISYSARRLFAFSEHERGEVYDVFTEYEKKKERNGEFDMSDLVVDLHHRLRDHAYEGEKMDFVYIDEVQDLTMRQISLFKYICRYYEEGFMFSGDTAQTIVRGVDFRFKDIRALFYREFGERERKGKGKISDLLHLSQNFRTHMGVLKLANSVLDLLHYFFPSSVDKLEPETSLLNGEQPILLMIRDIVSKLGSIFSSSRSIYQGFGAQQVILVRNEDDRNEIFNLMGKQALVLTIMECKGLEFQDVLLYNFFSSSPSKDKWNVIYGYMKGKGLLDHTHPDAFPIFHEAKHKSLCSELKQLYVAITRTRQRLWIFENTSCAIFNFWEKLQLINFRQLDAIFVQDMKIACSLEDWKAQGIKFFHQNSFDKARFCFQRAGESSWEKWAAAAGLRCIADHLRVPDPSMARVHLSQAAHIFESIGKNSSAAQCFFELNEYEKAGMIYLEKLGDSKLEEAGECFHLAGCHTKSAEIYAKCNLLAKCLYVCADGKLFEMGYKYIRFWKKNNFDLEDKVAQEFFEKGALHFHTLKDSKSMMNYVSAFQTEKLMRTFLKGVDRLDELLSLEIEWGNLSEAAKVANMKGDILLEADLLKMDRQFQEASRVILVYVLFNSLWSQEDKGWPPSKFMGKKELLDKAKTFSKNSGNEYYGFICNEANILSDGEVSLSEMEKYWISSSQYGSVRGKMLSARKILDAHLPPNLSMNTWKDDLKYYVQNNTPWDQSSFKKMSDYWNLWNREIETMLGRLQDESMEDSHSEFCMNYFGVSKQFKNKKAVFLVLCRNAAWLKEINHRNIKRNENSVWIDSDQFVRVAKRYWSEQTLMVGKGILEVLKAVYMFSAEKFCDLYIQRLLLSNILEVSKPLMESKFLDCGSVLQELQDPIRNFFGHFYPLDLRKSTTEGMIRFRGMDSSRILLRDICRFVTSWSKASEGTDMVITILLSIRYYSFLPLLNALSFGNATSWQVFVENFQRTIRQDVVNDYLEVSLVQQFHKALEGTDPPDFSPSCFLYFLDRLLIMVSCLKGCFMTTRSSLVEWLISNGWNTRPKSNSPTHLLPLLIEDIVHFIACTAAKLLCQEQEIEKWIKKFNMKMDCYPLLVLRIFVLVSLLCINFDGYSDLLFDMLGKKEVTSLLPKKFYDSLQILRTEEKQVKLQVVAEALKRIEDPLVIVNLGIEFSFPDAIFLNLNAEQDRKSTLNLLHPRFPWKRWKARGVSWKIKDTMELLDSSFVSIMLALVDSRGVYEINIQELVREYILLVQAAIGRSDPRDDSASDQVHSDLSNVLEELEQLHSAVCSRDMESENMKTIQNMAENLRLRRQRMEVPSQIDQQETQRFNSILSNAQL